MRIWSLHPKHLDAKGLVALWRETLLAKHVLEGRTKGYKNHPQLDRFKKLRRPVDGINQYLAAVYQEALRRGYNFDKDKIDWEFSPVRMTVTDGQVQYEREHLLRKLKQRDKTKFREFSQPGKTEIHPVFKKVRGDVEEWEIILK